MRQWYEITAKSDRTSLSIYDHIGQDFFGDGVSAKELFKEIEAIKTSYIDLFINSPGGNVFEGNSIYNMLRRHSATVEVVIDGIAASIASVIAMAGDKISMPENSMMMIHDPSGMVVGTADDMRKLANALDKVKIGLSASYQRRNDISDKKISQMMADETWLTAQEAVDLGLADEITEPVNIQANFQELDRFKNVPESLIPKAAAEDRSRINLHYRKKQNYNSRI